MTRVRRTDSVLFTSADGSFRFSAAEIEAQTGWAVRPEGLCRGEVCVPVRPGDGVEVDGRIDLPRFAAALGRPLAVDDALGVALLGESATVRSAQRAACFVGDVEATSLDGTAFRWSALGRKKKLLFAWASW